MNFNQQFSGLRCGEDRTHVDINAAGNILNAALRDFSHSIIPHENYLHDGNEITQKILTLLRSKSKFDIGRDLASGSYGKKTTILGSDFDCIVFINNQQPSFEKVLDDFEDVLTMAHGFSIENIKKTKFSVQFRVKAFEFDFLPAPNFFPGSKLSGDPLIDQQQGKTLDKIKENIDANRYAYSGGLASAVVRFMKNQDGFVNEMVRTCKFWFQTLYLPEYISGAKSLIELVAVFVANKEDAYPSKSYLRCFSGFLNQIENFDDMKIIFEKEYRKFPNHPVPGDILRQRPIVLDPTNPYNNLAKNWDKHRICKDFLKTFAAETKKRIVQMHRTVASSGGRVIPMEILFEPQPKVAPVTPDFKNAEICVSMTKEIKNYPDKKVRNEKVMKIPGIAIELAIMEKYLILLLHSYTASRQSGTFTREEFHNQVTGFIDANILGVPKRKWDVAELHNSSDVTYTLPAGNFGSVLISWCFKK